MEIRTIEIAGFASAFTALRLPFGLPPRSNIVGHIQQHRLSHDIVSHSSVVVVEEKDMERMRNLVISGDEHSKVVRGILAYTEITAPVYWWCELETYRAGHERLSSSSTMHIDCKGLQGEELQRVKAEIPMGKELTKVDFFSYQCLRNIVKQRYNHRLPEWHMFIDWIKTLPFAKELIFNGLDYDDCGYETH